MWTMKTTKQDLDHQIVNTKVHSKLTVVCFSHSKRGFTLMLLNLNICILIGLKAEDKKIEENSDTNSTCWFCERIY